MAAVFAVKTEIPVKNICFTLTWMLLLSGLAVGQSGWLTFTTLFVPGGYATAALGINNRGCVVGQWDDSVGGHAFRFCNGIYSTFDGPNAMNTGANGINDLGQVVGWYEGADQFSHGFLRTAAEFTTLDYPGAQNTLAYGINSSGQIVGVFWNAGSAASQGFEFQSGQYTAINYPGAASTAAYGINEQGQIVGSYAPAGSSMLVGFLDDGGTFSSVTVLGTSDPALTGITDKRIIVGFGQFQKHHNVVQEGLVDLRGKFRQVFYPGSINTVVFGVNGKQEMVGSYYTDTQYGFVATVSP